MAKQGEREQGHDTKEKVLKKYRLYQDGKDIHVVVCAASARQAVEVARARFPNYMVAQSGKLTARLFRVSHDKGKTWDLPSRWER